MPTYDAVRFSPPAPVATIELRETATGKISGNVPMLLDTGADVTLLPREFVNRLQIPLDPSQVYELMGFDGTRSTQSRSAGAFSSLTNPMGCWDETS